MTNWLTLMLTQHPIVAMVTGAATKATATKNVPLFNWHVIWHWLTTTGKPMLIGAGGFIIFIVVILSIIDDNDTPQGPWNYPQ